MKSEMAKDQVLYTRAEAGCYPVRVNHLDEGGRLYLLDRPDGTVVYPSARKLLIAITGQDRHWTFERYFRTGRYALSPGSMTSDPIFEILGPGGWGTLTTPTGPVQVQEVKRSRGRKSTGKVYPTQTTKGIDLVVRGKEVAKLLFAGFSGMIRAGGYDPEDVLQEVFKGILVRNAGTCPFDPVKASFGHYVHMVCRCILANYHRRHQRHYLEHTGLPGYGDEGMDAGDDRAVLPVKPTYDLSDALVLRDVVSSLKAGPHRGLAVQVLPLLREGRNREEISSALGESPTNVGRAMTYLREHLRTAYRAE